MKFFPMLMTLTCSAVLFNTPAFAENKQDRKTSKTVASKSEQKTSKETQTKASRSKDQAKNTSATVADRKTSAQPKNVQTQQTQNQDKNVKKSDKHARKSNVDVAPQQVQHQDKKRSKRQEQRPNLTEPQAQQKKDQKTKVIKPTVETVVVENNIAGETPSPKKATRRPHKSGVASWYGGYFHGRLTANGERYNMNELTAAHRTLPFGTQVRVTNLRNNKSVTVRINDRGPYSKGRVIDLSRKANQMIDCHLCQVSIEVLAK